jgi:putative colanic acid biosynthesis glycosyltransferase
MVIVTVVTVVKDDLQGLKRTATSVRAQTSGINWVLVTPNIQCETNMFIKGLQEMGIVTKVIFDSGDGVYSAMNLAINELDLSSWIWFLNAGDEFASNESVFQVNKAIKSSTHRWLYGGHELASLEGKRLGKFKIPKRFKPSNQLYARKYISHQSTVFKNELLVQLNGFNEKYKIAADWDLLVRASKIDSGFRLNSIISIFHMGGISTQNRNLGNRELLELRRLHLHASHQALSLTFFVYRLLRNLVVARLEYKIPAGVNRLRTFRLKIKNFSLKAFAGK